MDDRVPRGEWSILYIDADEADYILAREMLSEARGYRVRVSRARSYEEGEAKLASQAHDAVLVEYDLGGRTGIDLIRAYSAQYSCPFILYTGRGGYEMELEAMQAGASLYLVKGEITASTLERFIRFAIERKQLQQELETSYRQKSTILESIQDGLYGLDREWRFTYVNSSTAAVLGRRVEDLAGRNIWEAFPRLLGTMVEVNYRAVMADRQPVKLDVPGQYSGGYFSISVYPSEEGISVYWQDITRQRQAEQELEEVHRRATWMARFPDENPNPVARAALDGTVLYHNRVAEQAEGWSFRQGERMPPPFLALLGEAVAQQRPVEREVLLEGKYYSISLTPFLEDGYLNIYGKDISQRRQMEMALRESEERFRALLEPFIQAVWETDPSGLVVHDSPTWRAYTGQTLEEWLGEGWANAVHPADRGYALRLWQQAARDRTVFDAEFRLRSPDGGWRWTNVRGTPLRGADGEVIKWVGMNIDITERKLAEEALRQSYADLATERNRLLAVMEALPLGVAILDLKGGIVSKNRGYDEVWGGPVPETNTVQDYAAFHAWWAETGQPLKDEDWGSAIAIRTGKSVLNQYLRIQSFDAGPKNVLNSSAPIFDSLGNLTGCVVAIRDITRLVETENDLSAVRDRFRVALQSMPIMVYTCNRDLRYTWVYQPLRGLTVEGLVGKRDDEILPEVSASELIAIKQQALETGQGSMQEIKVPLNGEDTYYILTTDPIRDRLGNVTGLTCSVIDITEQKRLEFEQREQAIELEVQRRLMDQRERERSAFARELHDGPIQTLSATLFLLHTLSEDTLNPGLRADFEQARNDINLSIQELRDVMNDLRPPALLHFDISRVIQYVTAEYQARFPGIAFRLELDEDQNNLPEQTRLSLFRIYQAGINNIIRHSGATQVNVRFWIRDGNFLFEIQDNGAGFDSSQDFDLLSSGGHFGLVGMKERAEALGGRLEIQSKPAEGTLIRVTGPAEG